MSVRFDTKQFSTADRKDKAPSTQCRRSLKMQLYSGCGWAYRPHWSVTKTKLFENALQTERIWNAGLAFWHDANRKHFNKLTHFLKTMTMIPLPKLSSNTLLRKTRNEGKIRWIWLSWSVKRKNVFHHFTDKRMGWNLFFSGIASLQQDGVRWPPNANFFILHILFYCVFIKMESLPQYCVINWGRNLWGSLMDSEKCILHWEAAANQSRKSNDVLFLYLWNIILQRN